MNTIQHDPAVSVIVPVYNVERFISRCLSSLLDQDCVCRYEIIVVDDGSLDGSSEIITDFAERYDIIRVCRRENGGLSAARNTGLAAARGKYVMFTDGDDYVEPNYISALYNAAEDSCAEIACCNYRSVDERGKHSFGCFRHKEGVFSSESMMNALLNDITVRGYVWNKIYLRSLFIENGIEFPVGMTFEDVSVMPQLFYYAKRIAVVGDATYNYVRHKGSITGSIKLRSVEDYVSAYGDVRRFLERVGIYSQYEVPFRSLGRKISATVFVMLLRCRTNDPGLQVMPVFRRLENRLRFNAAGGYAVCPDMSPNSILTHDPSVQKMSGK